MRLAEAFAVLPAIKRGLPEARLPFERPPSRSRSWPRRRAPVRAPLVAPARAARGGRGDGVARPGADRAAGRGADRLSRRRAHLDRDVRDGRAGRRRSTSAAARTSSARSRSRPRSPARPRSSRPRGTARRHDALGARRRGRRRGRGVRLDGTEPGAAPFARPRPSGRRAPAPALDERAERGTARGRRGRAADACSRPSKQHRDHGAHATPAGAARPDDLRPPGREDARRLLQRRVLQPHPLGAAPRRTSSAGRDAGLPAEAGDARRHGRGGRRSSSSARDDWDGPDRSCAPRRRPGRAVGDGDDDRGRLHAVRAPGDGRSSARSPGGR